MSKTLQQLDSLLLGQIREVDGDTHFTTDQRYGYINQAIEHIALISNPPEDTASVAVEANKGLYLLPSDNLVINSIFFGDTQTYNDTAKLTSLSKINANNIFPSWQDETSDSSSKPTHWWYYDDTSIFIYPKPSATYAGKRLILNYGFSPALLSQSGDVPDIKPNYHNLIPFLAASFAFYALPNTEAADKLYLLFKNLFSEVKDAIEKRSEENMAFKWSVKE